MSLVVLAPFGTESTRPLGKATRESSVFPLIYQPRFPVPATSIRFQIDYAFTSFSFFPEYAARTR